MGEGPVQQKALKGPEDTTRFTGGFDTFVFKMYEKCTIFFIFLILVNVLSFYEQRDE